MVTIPRRYGQIAPYSKFKPVGLGTAECIIVPKKFNADKKRQLKYSHPKRKLNYIFLFLALGQRN